MTDQIEQDVDTKVEQVTDNDSEQSTDNNSEQENKTQDSDTEQSDSKAEQGKAEKAKETFAGTVLRVQEMVNNQEEVPSNLMWAMKHVDVSKISQDSEETDEDKFEKMYNERRDSEMYQEIVSVLDQEYEPEKTTKIKEEIDDLVTNHGMTRMKAYSLVSRGLGDSPKQQLKTRLDSQKFYPPRMEMHKPNDDKSDFVKMQKAMENVGVSLTEEEYKKGKEEGLY